ncbi:MAG TPA: hypothetical protein VJ044_08535, partial [Candidatus Hodarchaeales archaeon]|nr:hypothetical protein [Candidatus Hodarchaeales archaeon]
RIVHDGFQASLSALTGSKKKKKDETPVFQFTRPSGIGLSPLGEERLKRGLIRELNPEIAESVSRQVNAYGGQPFVVEAAIAYGGTQLEEESPSEGGSKETKNVRIYRFANRIPLLFGAGNDIVTKVIFDEKSIPWKDYKVNLNTAPVAIAVSLVSTKIPFPETSKEYIADVQEIREELLQALKVLASRIRTFLSKKERNTREQQRRSRFEQFAPSVAKAISDILLSMPEDSLPLDTTNIELLISKALIEAQPKSYRRYKPPTQPIYSLKAWIDLAGPMRRALDNIGIATATDFLFASEEDLGKTAILTPERAEQIKRVSVMRLDLDPQAPRAMDLDLFPSWLEKGLVTFEKIDKAMSKRWISSVWDFFATKDKEFLFIGGFFEKVLYMEKFRLVQSAKKLGFLENKLHRLGSLDWITPEIEKEFKGKGIAAKAEFMLKFNNEIYGKSGFDNFLNYALKFVKTEVLANYNPTENITAAGVEWLNGESKKALNSKLKLKTWQDLIDEIDAHPENVLELEVVLEGVIDEIKSRAMKILVEGETAQIPLGKCECFTEEMLFQLSKKKILSVYEFLFIDPSKFEESVKHYMIRNFRREKLLEFNSKHPAGLEKLVWIPQEVEQKLMNAKISHLYDLLTTPMKRLSSILGESVPKDFIKDLKVQWGIPLNYLAPDVRQKFNSYGIFTTEEVIHLDEQAAEEAGANSIWNEIKHIQDTLNLPIVHLPAFPPKSVANVTQHGILTIYDFFIWPENEYSRLKMELMDVLELKKQINLEEIAKLASENEIQLDGLKFIPAAHKKLLASYGISSADQVLFLPDIDLIPPGTTQENSTELKATLRDVRRLLGGPVVSVPTIDPIHIRKFLSAGIRRISDLLYWPDEELGELLPQVSEFKEFKRNLTELRPGKALKDTELLSQAHARLLSAAEVRTVEDVYFTLNSPTFAIEGVDWSVIKDIKQMLDLPVGIIVFDAASKKTTKKPAIKA